MAEKRDWTAVIGRRIRLRDLHLLFSVVQHGSMAKAGRHLGMTQSAVSQAIAVLEGALGVNLLDRTSRGVELTVAGAALLQRGRAAFDELRAGIEDIERLADPAIGEVRVACTESIAAGILPMVIERFCLRYPKVDLHIFQNTTHLTGFASLHERKADVVLTLRPKPFESDLTDRLHAEPWFDEQICLAAAKSSPWARRRKIELGELAGAPLIMPAADTPGGAALTEALRGAGQRQGSAPVTTFSVHLRAILGMRGRFIALLPASTLRFNPGVYSLKELPVDVRLPVLPALIVTLKDRTLSPPVERFIECAREVARTLPSPRRR